MTTITVRREHQRTPSEILARIGAALETAAREFDATDVVLKTTGSTSEFTFRTMGFKVDGQVRATESDVVVQVELPKAAAPFQGVAEEVIARNIDAAIA